MNHQDDHYKHFYRCFTCQIQGIFAFCQDCLETCHKNHETEFAGYGRGSCDCHKFVECEQSNESKIQMSSLDINNEKEDQLNVKQTNSETCTYHFTKNNFHHQPFYRCLTCGLKGNLGCCESCAKSCHDGHLLLNCGEINCFCDCSKEMGGNPCTFRKE